jgi:hypothetical protein
MEIMVSFGQKRFWGRSCRVINRLARLILVAELVPNRPGVTRSGVALLSFCPDGRSSEVWKEDGNHWFVWAE